MSTLPLTRLALLTDSLHSRLVPLHSSPRGRRLLQAMYIMTCRLSSAVATNQRDGANDLTVRATSLGDPNQPSSINTLPLAASLLPASKHEQFVENSAVVPIRRTNDEVSARWKSANCSLDRVLVSERFHRL